MNQSNFQLDPSGAELLQLLRERNTYRDTAADLLEALRDLEYAVRQFTNAAIVDWPELTAARAAIARAQGEA